MFLGSLRYLWGFQWSEVMRPIQGKLTSVALAAALVFSSTAAIAAPAGPDAWTTLSMMNPAGATALGGAAVAAQPVVVEDQHDGFYLPIPVLAVILAVVAVDIWILTKDHHHHHFVSPA